MWYLSYSMNVRETGSFYRNACRTLGITDLSKNGEELAAKVAAKIIESENCLGYYLENFQLYYRSNIRLP